MFLLLAGLGLLSVILSLLWLKDWLESRLLARIAHSEPIARLAVVGAAFVVLGLLLILSDYTASSSG